MSKWKKFVDENKTIVAVFTNLKHAFETIDHKILFEKLKWYGLVVTSYLSDRKQKTIIINSTFSGIRDTDMGVPQGSVLGLFSSYNKGFISRFADDTLGAVEGSNIDDVVLKINLALS